MNPRDRVHELLARLVRIGGLVQRRSRAEGKSRAAIDGDLRRQAEGVRRELLLERSDRARQLRNQDAAVLITCTVQQVWRVEIFPSGDRGVRTGMAGAEAANAVRVRGLCGYTVQPGAAHEVVLKHQLVAIVGAPIQ